MLELQLPPAGFYNLMLTARKPPVCAARGGELRRSAHQPQLAVLGARNLGRAVLHHFRADGWEGAAVARSAASLEGLDGIGIQADVSDPDALNRARRGA